MLPTYEQSRAHFGAWAVVSSPLILGFDLSNSSLLASVWDIITNVEAIQISQSFAGSPGRLTRAWNPGERESTRGYVWGVDCDSASPSQRFHYDPTTGFIGSGELCVSAADPTQLTVEPCDRASEAQQWTLSAAQALVTRSGACLDLFSCGGPIVAAAQCTNSTCQAVSFNATDGSIRIPSRPPRCLAVRAASPAPGSQMQLWTKPLAGGSIAALLLNNDGAKQVEVDLIADLKIASGAAHVRDVWLHSDLPPALHGTFVTDAIAAFDSRFYIFSPVARSTA